MWYPAKAVGAPSVEPVTLDEAKTQCRIASTSTAFNTELTRLIRVARDHVEKYCDMRFAERTVTLECSSFADFGGLPEAPLKLVTSITYVDPAGNPQVLDEAVYAAAGDRFCPAIVLKAGQSWPAIAGGSRIEVVAVFGGDAPDGAVHAMLLLIGHWFSVKEAVNVGNIVSQVPMGVDALLANERRGGWR